MDLMIYILAALLASFIITIMVSRAVMYVSYREGIFKILVTIIGCGVCFDFDKYKPGIVFGQRIIYFKLPSRKTGRVKEAAKKKKVAGKKKKKGIGIPISTGIKIGRAGLLFGARIFSRIEYEESFLRARPVIANPALAGIAYGWGKAFYGIFPEVGQTIDIAPSFNGRKGSWNGHLKLSIKIRQIVYAIYLFLRDLPINEIIKFWWRKRGR